MKNILFAASECVPFVKTGGLADVVGALPKSLDKEKYDVVSFGAVITNNKTVADSVGTESDTFKITYDEIITDDGSGKVYNGNTVMLCKWINDGSEYQGINRWDRVLSSGQYLITINNLKNGSGRYARSYLIVRDKTTGDEHLIYGETVTYGEIPAIGPAQ